MKSCSSLVKIISDEVNNFICKINAISGWGIETYVFLNHKNANMGSSTVYLHGVDLIDMQVLDWLWKRIFILYKKYK